MCFQWPLRIKRGIWTNSPLGQRGWNNHHTLHGGNHLMLKPLDPLIPEAKLSHTVITSAPFLLLDLQCVCVCVCLKWSSFKSFTSYRQEMWLWAQEYAITLGLFTAPLYARPHYQTSTQHSVECKPPTGPTALFNQSRLVQFQTPWSCITLNINCTHLWIPAIYIRLIFFIKIHTLFH